MGTVVEKYQYLEGTKQAIKKAIKGKGVDVSDTDTFRSYAEKIESIGGGGGGSSVAEYKFIKEIKNVVAPSDTISVKSSNFFSQASDASAKSGFYSYKGDVAFLGEYDESYKIINKDETESLTNGNMWIKFADAVTIETFSAKIGSDGWKLYATNDEAVFKSSIQSNTINENYGTALISYGQWCGEQMTDFAVNPDKVAYKYYMFGYYQTWSNIYEIAIKGKQEYVRMPLQSANIIPSIKPYLEDYLQVETQPYYFNGKVVDAQALPFKPYTDGGCLVNYTDNGKATNLKMYIMHPDNKQTIKAFVPPVLTENGRMGGDTFAVRANNESGVPGDKNYNPAYQAFDGNSETYWRGAEFPGYIDFYNPIAVTVKNIRWGFFYSYPTAGNVQGSNDGDEWELIKEWTNNMASDFDIDLSDNTKAFKYYRVNVYSVNEDVIHCASLTITGEIVTVNDKPIYVLAPNDNFTLDGYDGKTQVADLNIPAHIYFNGTDWVMGE